MTKNDIINEFIIRTYLRGDFDAINHLWAVTYLGSPKRGDTEKAIEDSIRIGGTLLVLEYKSSGMICGTSWMTFDGRRIHLHHFGILPEYQGHGLSKVLLNESLEFVKQKGYQVKLEVHRSNIKAIELYKNAGFSYLGDYDLYIIRDTTTVKPLT